MNKVAAGLAALLMWCAANAQTQTQAHVPGAGDLDETVKVEHGALRGVARDPQGVLAFKGIPFAAAPVGALRWKSPEPALPWEGLRDATRVGNRCLYNVPETGLGGRVGEILQSEDCLFLNVWTAAKTPAERRPVMVWIHGCGFQFGTGRDPRTDGNLLAQKGVIVVSIHYRLGVFGYFAHPELRHEGRLSGNFGLQDQIAGLQWVQANIARFGGDPKNVTIFGESAGSQAVSQLMGSPSAKGLFHRAIGQSGSSLQELPTLTEMSMRGAAFGTAVGAKSIAELRLLSTERINTAAAWDFIGGAPMVFFPSIDGHFLPVKMDTVFQQGRQNDVPLLAGYNKAEEFAFLIERLPHRTAAEFRAAVQNLLGAEKMTAFLALYPSRTDAEALTAAGDLLGDIRQRAETWRWLKLHAQTGKSPVYGYILAYQSPYSPVASHGADMPFVFGNLVPQFFAPRAAAPGPADRKLSDQMMAYWVNFATHGNPNGPDLPPWPEYRAGGAMLKIQEDGSFAAGPPSDRQIARFNLLDGFLTSPSLGQP